MFPQINANISFHTKRVEENTVDYHIMEQCRTNDRVGYLFGIMNVNVTNIIKTNTPLSILLNIDISSSMIDYIDTVTKINQVTETLIKFINVLYEKKEERKIYISIQLFNDTAITLKPFTELTNETIPIFISLFQKLKDDVAGSTNLEDAFTECIHSFDNNSEIEDTTKIHILLTDGHPTQGSSDIHELSSILQSSKNKNKIRHICIGFGKEHNSFLLSSFGRNIENSEYWFIDTMKNTGSVYGEIASNLLIPYMYITIQPTNGNTDSLFEIYNWKINKWVTTYSEFFYENIPKIIHIRACAFTKNNKICLKFSNKINIYIKYINHKYISDNVNLIAYLFRQKVLELLSAYNSLLEEKYSGKNKNTLHKNKKHYRPHQTSNNKKENTKKIDDCISQMYDIFKDMSDVYNRTTIDDGNKTIIKHLMDDIYITIKMSKTEYGHMYSTARQSSQGQQTTHTVGIMEEEEDDCFTKNICVPYSTPPRLLRNNNIFTRFDTDLIDNIGFNLDSPIDKNIIKSIFTNTNFDENNNRNDRNNRNDEIFNGYKVSNNAQYLHDAVNDFVNYCT